MRLLSECAQRGTWPKPMQHNFRNLLVNGIVTELGDPSMYQIPHNSTVQFDFAEVYGVGDFAALPSRKVNSQRRSWEVTRGSAWTIVQKNEAQFRDLVRLVEVRFSHHL